MFDSCVCLSDCPQSLVPVMATLGLADHIPQRLHDNLILKDLYEDPNRSWADFDSIVFPFHPFVGAGFGWDSIMNIRGRCFFNDEVSKLSSLPSNFFWVLVFWIHRS